MEKKFNLPDGPLEFVNFDVLPLGSNSNFSYHDQFNGPISVNRYLRHWKGFIDEKLTEFKRRINIFNQDTDLGLMKEQIASFFVNQC